MGELREDLRDLAERVRDPRLDDGAGAETNEERLAALLRAELEAAAKVASLAADEESSARARREQAERAMTAAREGLRQLETLQKQAAEQRQAGEATAA